MQKITIMFQSTYRIHWDVVIPNVIVLRIYKYEIQEPQYICIVAPVFIDVKYNHSINNTLAKEV